MKRFRNAFFYLCFFPFVLLGCKASGPHLFGKQNLHEQYAQKLTNAGLKETALGTQWFSAAEQALASPVAITLPYKEIGYFSAEAPRAVGLQFSGKQGEKLIFQLNKNAAKPFVLYADLWEVSSASKPSFIRSIDTAQQTFELEIEDASTHYILRLQPELLKSMDYELSVSISPSLAFPVAGKNARIASVWGDARNAGARAHEGIDIFAPKRTPALAAEDGTVTRVNENNLGGLVVWLRPKNKNYNLYYAHLDEQLATAGQKVSKGDTIGLIGNTGNARSTPPHLHFGIYAFNGAIDPLPFVNPEIKKPATLEANRDLKETKFRLSKSTMMTTATFANAMPANTVLQPLAITTKGYRVAFPNGMITEVSKAAVQKTGEAIRKAQVSTSTFLLDRPTDNAARKKQINASTAVSILGLYENYYMVALEGDEGWITASAIK